MRPEISNKQDIMDRMLEKAWETPPLHLENQLQTIPSQIGDSPTRQLERLSWIFNGILASWVVGLLLYFWTPIESILLTFSKEILGISVMSGSFLAQPVVGLMILAGLMFGWVWMDTERHHRAT
jgi:hypothetical protein